MTGQAESVRVTPFALEDLAPGGPHHESFVALQAPWTDRGVGRWIGLVRPDARRPVMAAGAWAGGDPQRLVGTMVGVWHTQVLDRFDDLFEPSLEPDLAASALPNTGCWHFISVTIADGWQGRGIGRRMVREALRRLSLATPEVLARTLSPALGLADSLGTTDGASVEPGVLDAAVQALPIVRFHCANGARLDATLPASRGDDLASAQVTLRFAYDVPAVEAT